MRHIEAWFLVVAAMAAIPAAGQAQVRASERGGSFQVVNGTTITIEYSRPSVRGRLPIFGGQIPWGEVWTPGANWATTLEVDHDVSINGHPVKKGKYSVWMEVQPAEWTVILDPRARLFHIAHPKPDSMQVRFPVTPSDVQGADLLTWSFPAVSPTGTTLRMAWAGKSVALQITVPPVEIPVLAAGVGERYVGRYSLWWAKESNQSELRLTSGNGRVTGKWSGPPFKVWTDVTLVPVAENWFNIGAMVDGSLFDVVKDVVFEFAVVDGKATGFDIRGPNDNVIGHGTRIE
jgi:hypothetical protein